MNLAGLLGNDDVRNKLNQFLDQYNIFIQYNLDNILINNGSILDCPLIEGVLIFESAWPKEQHKKLLYNIRAVLPNVLIVWCCKEKEQDKQFEEWAFSAVNLRDIIYINENGEIPVNRLVDLLTSEHERLNAIEEAKRIKLESENKQVKEIQQTKTKIIEKVVQKKVIEKVYEEKIIGTVIISVMGASRGCGCTHSCISMANFLLNLKALYKVAIVEMNSSGDMARFENNSIYKEYDQSRFSIFYDVPLTTVLSDYKFDYIILDFGCLFPLNKNIEFDTGKIDRNLIDEFRRSDVKILVGQPSIWNIDKYLFYIKNNSTWQGQNSDNGYILNLCDDKTFNSLREFFDDNTFHVSYSPELITLTDDQKEVYSKILSNVIPADSTCKKRLNVKKLIIDVLNYAIAIAIIGGIIGTFFAIAWKIEPLLSDKLINFFK